MSPPDIPLDDPDRATAARLLDEVMFGDHSFDSANAVIAQGLKDARREVEAKLEKVAALMADLKRLGGDKLGEDFDRGASYGFDDAATRLRAVLDGAA